MRKLLFLLLIIPFFAKAEAYKSLYFSNKDVGIYNTALNDAKNGKILNNSNLENKSLSGYINGVALLNQKNLDIEFAINWLSENPNNNNYNLVLDKLSAKNPNKVLGLRHKETYGYARQAIKLPFEKNRPNSPQISQLKSLFNVNNDNAVLAADARLLSGTNAFEANWYSGLSAYRLGNFKLAKNLFLNASKQNIDDNEKSAALFWTGRCALKIGENVNPYFEAAANYPITFYGQIASMKLNNWNNIIIPNGTYGLIRKIIENDENIRIAILLNDIGQKELAEKEIEKIWQSSNPIEDSAFLFIASNLGFERLKNQILQVPAVKIANSFPIPNVTPKGGDYVLDRALIFAIMRQESKFNNNSISYVGARGLMQLMPATAAWMANRPELKQNPNLLHDTELNVLLGEGYLEKLLNMQKTENNLARILIAYNAGPGNLSYWLRNIKGSEDTLLLIEAIPNNEARNYAKKVLSNLWIYHKRLGQNAPTLQKLANDLPPDYEPQDNPRNKY